MRRSIVIAAAFTLGVGLRADAPPAHPVSIADLLSIRQVAAPRLSPDGGRVLYTVRGWENGTGREAERKDSRAHVWRVGVDGTGARQLTFSDRGETAAEWSPDGASLSFLSARDAGGAASEGEGPVAQIWIMPADGGEAWKLTDSKESIATYAWSPNGKSIAYVSRDALSKESDGRQKRRDDAQVFEGDFRPSHVFVVDLATHETVEALHDPALTVHGTPSWSSDSARFAVSAAPTTMVRDRRSDVFIVTAASKAREKITVNPGPDDEPAWSPDGGTIAFTSEPGDAKPLADGTLAGYVGNSHLTLYDVRTKQLRDAGAREFDLSPGPLFWSADSRRILFTAGVRTARDVFAYDVTSAKYSRLTEGRVASLGSVGKDRVALVVESSSEPPDVFVADVSSVDRTQRKLTEANPHARSFALGASEVISWKSDGFTVEGVLLKPVNFQPGRRYPLLVVAHGGPSGAYIDSYRVGYGDGSQNWAGEGWAVLYPNPRGSTNYGERFERANFKDWGGGDYRDIMSGVDAVVAKGIGDPDRLAFMGWSYGGYMTCWVVSQTTRFKAAMMGAGLTDLPSMYGTNDIPNVLVPYFGGILSKETMPLYAERSGITYVDRVATPLLILQGGSDQRVPIGQPMEFFRALKDRGKTVELVFYPREGHGFAEYYHELDRLQRQHDWLVRYTLGANGKKTSNP